MGDIVIGGLLCLIVLLAIRSVIHSFKSHSCAGCSKGCAGCHCHAELQQDLRKLLKDSKQKKENII